MLGLLISNSLRLLNSSYNEQIQTRVEELASLLDAAISARLFERDHASVVEILNDLVQHRNSGFKYIVVYDDQFKLFAKSGTIDPVHMPQLDNSLNDNASDLVYDNVSPLKLSGERIGQVRYGLALDSLVASRDNILKQGIFIASVEVTLSCLLLGIAGFFLTRHICHLLKATEIISGGDYTHRIAVQSKDEIGLLGESFNNMTAQLKLTIDQKDAMAKQLQIKARDLENQKFALDEHAIVSILNQQGLITYVNDTLCQISQFEKEEILGKKYNFLNGGTDTDRQCIHIWDSIQRGTVWHGEIKNKKKDGSYYWVETSIVPFLNQQGIPYQYVSIQTDITSTRESEALIRKQYALANTITGLQESFIIQANSRLFETMLADFRALTQSCCGFLGEIHSVDNHSCLRIQASKNIDWRDFSSNDEEIREFNPLFNLVSINQQLVIVNDVTAHPYSGHFPQPSEPLENFIMLPLVRGDHTVGVLGLVNREEGFDSEIAEFLEPLTMTCTNIIEAYKNVERRKEAEKALKVANEELEIRVQERTGELLESNRHLQDSKSRITAIMENVADGIITYDENNIIESFNRAAEQIFGYSAAEASGRNIAFLIRIPQSLPSASADISDLTQHLDALNSKSGEQSSPVSENTVINVDESIWQKKAKGAQSKEVTAMRKDGGVFPLELSVRQVTLDNQCLSIAIVRDITERKAELEHLQHLADHDALTGLFNRNFFHQELDRLVEQIKRSEERQSALFYIDLDNFKYVNDTLGHAAGDEVLKDVTAILKTRTRKADLLCRLGGDEFTVIIYNTNEEQAKHIAESFRQEMQSYAYTEGKHKIDVGCSIGIALITQDSKSSENILAHADYACYQAKRAGRNRVCIFNEAS
jgi:diguanylate cyclase (GGDEF)-like protein/PAS domain S-box-containing protein